jgi:acyl carrier protein
MQAMISHVDLKQAIADFTKRPAPELKDEDTLGNLNLDSLALLEIIGMLEDRHGVQVDEDDLVDLKNVGDLLRILNNAAKSES